MTDNETINNLLEYAGNVSDYAERERHLNELMEKTHVAKIESAYHVFQYLGSDKKRLRNLAGPFKYEKAAEMFMGDRIARAVNGDLKNGHFSDEEVQQFDKTARLLEFLDGRVEVKNAERLASALSFYEPWRDRAAEEAHLDEEIPY